MKVYEMIFSPTGGTKKAAGLFMDSFCRERTYIDLTNRKADFSSFSFDREDICVAAVPSYGGRVPEIAVSRLKQMKGNGARAVLLVVYGNREYEDTLLELSDVMEAAGFSPVAAVAAVAEHSIMHQFAAGRPDEDDEKELKGFAEAIRNSLEQGEDSPKLHLPGNRPYKEYHGIPMKPKADKECVRCGICASMCPTGAIPEDNPMETKKGQCISCMRCIAVCPRKARSVSKVMLAASVQKLKKACSGRKKNQLFQAF